MVGIRGWALLPVAIPAAAPAAFAATFGSTTDLMDGRWPLRLTVGAKLAHAVQRNRARRIMRAALSEHLSQNIGGYDIILVARARTPYLKSTQLSKTLAGLMRKAGLPDKAAAVPQQPAAKPQPNGAPE